MTSFFAPPQVAEVAEKRRERLNLMRRTHDIFVGLSGKSIKLIAGNPPGHTDTETFISVPVEDDQVDLIHKHEWQHIFMGSDLRAREEFVKQYADKVLLSTPNVERMQLEIFLHMFVNILDDLRVNDLWKRPYPQSAEDIEERWRGIILQHKGYQQDLLMYSMAVGLGLKDSGQLIPSVWDKHLPLIREGISKIWGHGAPAPMIAVKIILDGLLNEVLQDFMAQQPQPNLMPSVGLAPPEPPGGPGTGQGPQNGPGQVQSPKRLGGPSLNRREPSPQQQQASQGMQSAGTDLMWKAIVGTRHSKSLEFFRDTQKPEGADPNWWKTKAVAQAAMGAVTPDQVQKVLEDSKREVEQAIAALLGKTKKLSKDQKLIQGLEGRVQFRDLKPSDVEPFPLNPDDHALVLKLKNTFSRLMDKKRKSLSSSGTSINVPAYIDYLAGSGDDEFFDDEEPQKGFSALLLVDMSGSMNFFWEDVSRAAKVLAKSLKFPFSRFEVWGFSGDTKGQAFIHRFLDPEFGYQPKDDASKEFWGTTPLHIATEVAVRKLERAQGAAHHLFILTDGVPMHIGVSGSSSSRADLMASVARSIRRGRARGVNTMGIVLGAGIKDEFANVMFGSDRQWIRAENEVELFVALIALVQNAFVGYLKR
jgi:hypothetical protein